jgi:hypothetical protein
MIKVKLDRDQTNALFQFILESDTEDDMFIGFDEEIGLCVWTSDLGPVKIAGPKNTV